MTELTQIAEFLNDKKLAGTVVFGSATKEDGNMATAKTKPQKRVTNSYRTAYYKKIRNNQQKNIVPYSATDADPDEIMEISVNDIPNIDKIIGMPANDRFDIKNLKSTKFTAFHFQNNELGKVIVLREYETSPFLSKKRLDLLSFTNHVLGFTKKDSIRIDRRIDCIIRNDKILIFRKKGFERIFDYKQIYKKQAKKVFQYLRTTSTYTVENLDMLENSCTDLRSLRQISNIYSSGEFQKVDIDKINSFSKKNTDLEIKVDLSTNKVDFGNLKNMLHFYNEDYYTIEYTGNRFTAFLKKQRNVT